ncbi:acetyl-coenzyme-A carboxylase, partial [Tulasnella sp. 427]
TDFVKEQGGHTVITKVLIANNGIAAVKEIRSIRKWSYETFGTERAVEFTVMATPEDLKVNADYIRMADRYIEVPGGTNNNNYANVDFIVDVAERAGVHAVWAGWGHASENPRLPESLASSKHKIVFIGPPGSAMRSLGDKISSTIVAQSANVPTMAWSGTGITNTQLSEQGFVTVPDDAYQDACVTTVEQGLQKAEAIGWPVMIKASEGGGGKGIRKVDGAATFKNSFEAVASEVPGSPIFIMKLAGSARHLEVQVLADQYGNAISLFGRDCSVQRRHQKIIEEAPVTIAKPETFEEMEKAAVRLAKLVGYVSAGTVEYLYSPADDTFCFLELNPRLQVEHPTTEMVSGVNLPAAQLQVAMGIPLHRIRDIRVLYGMAPTTASEIDFDMVKPESNQLQRRPTPKGHVVAVRITAENPDAGFKPSSGSLQELNFRSNTNVWGYFSVGTAGGLHEFADSQFGHIFAYGADRTESRKNMVIALKELSIRGDFRTTVEYLIKLLETQAFEENTFTTGWLDMLISDKLTAERPDATLAVICGAVVKAHVQSEACWAEFRRILDKGQVPARDTLKTVFMIEFIYEGSRYSFTATRSSVNTWTLYLNGGRTSVGARPLADGGILVLLAGASHSVYWREEVGATRLMVDAKTCLIEQENDPTQLRSPSPGKLVRFLVDSGEHINAGDTYAEIEVMKMIMPLVATEDGIPHFVKQPGASLEPGDILGVLTLDDPGRVKHAKPFEGQLAQMGDPSVVGTKPHQRYAHLIQILDNILDGYDNQPIMTATLKELIEVLHNAELPYSEVGAVLASLSGRIPGKLEEAIRAIIDSSRAKSTQKDFPAPRILKTIDTFLTDNVIATERTMLPSYQERAVQMESVLKMSITSGYYGESSINRGLPSPDILKELTDSRWVVFDVLPTFFNHDDPWVSLAALEVYVRRAYRAYSILSLDHDEGDDVGDHEPFQAVTWRFKLGQSRSAPQTPRLADYDKKRQASVSDLTYMINSTHIEPIRHGAVVSFPDYESCRDGFAKFASLLPAFDANEFAQRHGAGAQPPNVMYVALRIFDSADDKEDAEWRSNFLALLKQHKDVVDGHGVRRVTFLICRPGEYPFYYTMRANPDGEWIEEEAIRNIEPALAYQLELSRLSNYKLTPCFTEDRQIHIYHGVARENQFDSRFFVRALVRPGRLRNEQHTAEYLISQTDHLVGSILDALEIVVAKHRNADCNHISVNFIYNLKVTYAEVLQAVAGFIDRHGKRLWRLRVTGAEIRIVLEDDEGNVTPIRAVIENVSGFVVNFHGYQEIVTDKSTTILKAIGDKGPLHLQPVNMPFPTKESLQPKRYQAHLVGTTYVYDFPDLFSKSLQNLWSEQRKSSSSVTLPAKFLESKELVMDENEELQEVDRAPGNNACGMVAWVFTLYTPEYPKGRQAVVIANDITYKIGSFGPQEDLYFYKATEYARSRGLPRIYLSANSGARIGVAEEVLGLFSCAWNDDQHPEKGIDYLYLTPEADFKLREKGQHSVITEEITVNGEKRFKITDIVGAQDGLGVECLKGSGLIAGETSRAYDDIFTITLVTARSVGIGAYLVRLGQRAVQVEGQPIILTGAPALNKVLGREVYTSNLQLGGTQIMHKNGVSHLTAASDLEGTTHILRWLSYVPEYKGASLPVRAPASDSWDRDIGFFPPKGPYDPRWLIGGKTEDGGEFLSGFFDAGSFQETLNGWAQTVVVGRARLGGIPMGVIAVETRTTERVVPADPANASSFEQRIMEAGQVWFPNSAYKTAQAIFDFNREGLPLIIFANWRGFSGGQQDMYDEILKQGSKIVDGLSSYKQPVFVYIVPNGELRGGAWVVLDPSINPEQMEMYADHDARAGVLEPEGIVEIKMRRERLLTLMERLDSQYASLKKASKDASASEQDRATATEQLTARETLLMPTYKQLALLYADLHDRVGRMEAKGCAKPAQWKNARRYFYWALRARVARSTALAKIQAASPQLSAEERSDLVDSLIPNVDHEDRRAIAEALETVDLTPTLSKLKAAQVARQMVDLVLSDRKAALEGFARSLESLSEDEKTRLVKLIQSSGGPERSPAPPSYS